MEEVRIDTGLAAIELDVVHDSRSPPTLWAAA